ncbi:hypothetical protein D051_0046 [Vibrio parahaemolyticus VPCR-2010]|uniref:hypothetical protein n=1 Tax=Vibrio parahaemolyticus TaxID=670 RepID=UPI00038E5422|nr:hypothetical protein D051_0046 [Vibrio parahaemolyticus VPCR-2010]
MSKLFETDGIPEDFNELLSLDFYYQVCNLNQHGVMDKEVVIELNNTIFAPEHERRQRLIQIITKQENQAQKFESEEEIQYI